MSDGTVMKWSMLIVLAGLSLESGLAQTPDPASLASLGPASAPAPSDGTGVTLDYLFNRKPREGTVADAVAHVAGDGEDRARILDALMSPGMDDPITRSQFETYLGLPEVSADRLKEYSAKMGAISASLKSNDVWAAWKQLDALSGYPDVDAGVSRVVAHFVESILTNERATLLLDQANDRLRQTIETADRNADQIAGKLREQGSPGGNQAPAEGGSNRPGNVELSNEYARDLDARASLKLNDFQADQMMDQSRADFADYITILFNSHRHDQAILAAGFYRCLFPAREYPVSLSDEVDACLKNNQQADSDVQAFQHQLDQGQVAGATNRLLHGFIASPYQPAMLSVPRDERERVSAYLRSLDLLKSALETRDFTGVKEIVARVRQLAPDFDSTKVMAWTESVKIESTLRLGQARLLIQQGKWNEAMTQFQSAAESWSGNPELQAMADNLFRDRDDQSQAIRSPENH